MTERPNIVLIVADDMGYSDIGCYGGEIDTPNIDRLATGGIRFSRFYNNAVCMPTRASILTGLYPHQVGSADKAWLAQTGNVTIAEVLKEAGYITLMSGKWHNGTQPGMLPVDRGFHKYWGLLSGSSNYFNPGLRRPGEPEPAHKSPGDTRPWGEDDKIIRPYTPEERDFYATDAFTERAIQFLDKYGKEDRPFFLYLAYTAPHFPIQARPQEIAKYRGKYLIGWDELRRRRFERQLELGLAEKQWQLSERDELAPRWSDVGNKEEWDLKMAVYAAMIDRMDQGIGRVLEKIRQLGKEDNTLVVFLSDNGGCAEHIDRTPNVPAGPVNSYKTVDAPWANASNTPFRRFKAFDHEGGIATPCVMYWPKGIQGRGRICRDVGHVMDLMPTFVELAGAKYPEEYKGHKILPMEGRSLVPALQGKEMGEREPIFWEFRGCRAVLAGRWKLVTQGPARNHVNVPIGPGHDKWELYDMATDRCELHDLARHYPEKVAELDALWQYWYKRCAESAHANGRQQDE
ncbi:MAG: arylsulfatase [Armatimonadota bacterium]|nr:arylsulfatase [Armatimonadota bacterium]